MNTFLIALILIIISTSAVGSNLEILENLLLEKNPSIEVAYNTIDIAHLSEKITGSLPSPLVNFSYFGESVETRVGAQRWTLGVQQRIPWPHSMTLEREITEHQSEIVQYRSEIVQKNALLSLRNLWGDLYLLGEKKRITTEIRDLTEQWLEQNRISYETGTVMFSSFIGAETKLITLEDDIRSLQSDRTILESRFTELFGAEQELSFPNSLDSLKYDTSITALENHPLLLEITQKQVIQESDQDLQRSQFAPDFGVGFNYINIDDRPQAGSESGKDAWLISISMSLPLWFNSKVASVNRSELQQVKLISEETVIRQLLQRQRKESIIRKNDADQRIDLYQNSLIPQLEQLIAVQEKEYETGTTLFSELFSSYENLLRLKLRIAEAEKIVFQAEATLVWLAGIKERGDDE